MKISDFINLLKKYEFGPMVGVPCSVFKDLLNFIYANRSIEHYIATSEGEAMGIAAGFSLAYKYPIVYMQNDGFGNAINPLSSLQLLYKLPTLLLISWRGEPGKKDAPQHSIMGKTLQDFLNVLKIPYAVVNENNIISVIKEAKNYLKETQLTYALIIKKGFFEKFDKKEPITNNLEKRISYIETLSNFLNEKDIVIATTGFTGRELFYSLNNFNGKFYMVGSMGCAPAIGLGLSKSFNGKNFYVLDGDGALLMKLGSLATIGFYKPQNLIHICFDNNAYESTGGQKTLSGIVNFSDIASACGYHTTFKIDNTKDFSQLLSKINNLNKPIFIHIKISQGTLKDLPRPKQEPYQMKLNLKKFLQKK